MNNTLKESNASEEKDWEQLNSKFTLTEYNFERFDFVSTEYTNLKNNSPLRLHSTLRHKVFIQTNGTVKIKNPGMGKIRVGKIYQWLMSLNLPEVAATHVDP